MAKRAPKTLTIEDTLDFLEGSLLAQIDSLRDTLGERLAKIPKDNGDLREIERCRILGEINLLQSQMVELISLARANMAKSSVAQGVAGGILDNADRKPYENLIALLRGIISGDGISQADMAKKIGIGEATLSFFLNGKGVGPKTLKKITKYIKKRNL